MKMYITQLRGVFDKISLENEEEIEEVGRRLAQTLLSKGKVFVQDIGHPNLVTWEATQSENALPGAERLFDRDGELPSLSERDSILVFIASGSEAQGAELLDLLEPTGVQIIGALVDTPSANKLEARLDTVLHLPYTGPLIPLDDDVKRGNPESLSLLFLYHLIYFSAVEILSEQDLLDKD